jgi:hypothetical protein
MNVQFLLNELEEEARLERKKQCEKRLEAHVGQMYKPIPKSRAEDRE